MSRCASRISLAGCFACVCVAGNSSKFRAQLLLPLSMAILYPRKHVRRSILQRCHVAIPIASRSNGSFSGSIRFSMKTRLWSRMSEMRSSALWIFLFASKPNFWGRPIMPRWGSLFLRASARNSPTANCVRSFWSETARSKWPAYYASMGFAIPASVGAQLANSKLRPLVLVGDGAFQMTGLELATIARYQLNPVIVVLNNNGYGTERQMQDGPYNDVWPIRYSRFPEILGVGRGFIVETEQELDRALIEAEHAKDSFCLIEVRLAQLDRSPALDRLAARLARRL